MIEPSTVLLTKRLGQLARDYPDRTFLRFVGSNAPADETYGDTHARMSRWAGMVRELGVKPGEYVGTMLSSPRDCMHSWFGINAARCIEVPIHGEYRGSYLTHVLNTTGVRVVIVEAKFAERFLEVAEQLPNLSRVVIVGGIPGGFELPWPVDDATALLERAPLLDESEQLKDQDTCTILFTSGTTGLSKAVLVSYAHLRATYEGAWPVGDLNSEDRYYSMLPFNHVAAKVGVGATLDAAGQLVLRDRYSTSEFWNDVRSSGATCVCLMGSMAGFLLSAPNAEDDRGHSLKKALVLPLSSNINEFRQRFGVNVRTVYNQTETGSPLRLGYDLKDHRVTGRPRPGIQCRIVDENDYDVPVGTVGELLIRSDEPWSMMAGYLGMPEATVEKWRNLWLHTGDAFKMDEDGNYYFVDRLKDAIRRRGENISSVELEASVNRHPSVLECAAVGVQSEFDEEEVKIVVVPLPGKTIDAFELCTFLKNEVPRFMVPRYIEFVAELPRTPTEKIQKARLREAGVGPNTVDTMIDGRHLPD